MKRNIRVLTLSSVHESLFRANPSPHTPKMKLRFCSGGLSSTAAAAGRLQVGKRETEGEGERAPRASPVSPPRAMGSSAIFSASVGLSLSLYPSTFRDHASATFALVGEPEQTDQNHHEVFDKGDGLV